MTVTPARAVDPLDVHVAAVELVVVCHWLFKARSEVVSVPLVQVTAGTAVHPPLKVMVSVMFAAPSAVTWNDDTRGAERGRLMLVPAVVNADTIPPSVYQAPSPDTSRMSAAIAAYGPDGAIRTKLASFALGAYQNAVRTVPAALDEATGLPTGSQKLWTSSPTVQEMPPPAVTCRQVTAATIQSPAVLATGICKDRAPGGAGVVGAARAASAPDPQTATATATQALLCGSTSPFPELRSE
jgi:hypothetical protein